MPSQNPLFGGSSPNGIRPASPSGATAGAHAPKAGSPASGVTLIPAPGNSAKTASDPMNYPTTDGPANTRNSPMADDAFREKYLSFIQQVQKTLDDGKLPEALQALTTFYELPNLPEGPKREVEQLLDQLAGTVIYSRQNYLERPYVVQQGDTLDQIAERCGVPALLLARINGIEPDQVQSGQQLKILRGPFTAIVSLERHELMLKLSGGYYAGRFPIGLGTDMQKLEGTYTVQTKTARPIYRGPDGVNFSADDGGNPLGKYWIGLSDKIGLHGVIDETGIGRDDNRGTICLKDRDIDDLNGILSVGSQVIIRR
jgi:LysM repeat protein